MNEELITRIREYYGDNCFACGGSNPIGLHLDGFDIDSDGWVTASFEPRPDYRGAGDTLHGGVAATALDEILVWAGIATAGIVTVTATLDIRYRKPLSIHGPIVARGKVDERSGKRFRMSGHLDGGAGPAVEGQGVYLSAIDFNAPG